jgi:alpha-tubulin suppressor-like RCC1 family protein
MTWYVGDNSTNNSSFGMVFASVYIINASNLVIELRKKIDAALSEKDILYYTKAIQQLRTGNVFVVSYASDLPAPSTVLGYLYYVNETEILYIATVYGWVEIYTSTVNAIFSWGSGSDGRLGDGTVTARCSPVREICSATDWCQVSAGGHAHTVAVKISGQLWSWGSNTCGRLGNGTVTSVCCASREFCSATNWCQVSAGNSHTVAVKTSGELWAWGANQAFGSGFLGDGTIINSCSPIREFCSATDWCQVSAGNYQTTAIKTSGQLWSWGSNFSGKLGDGTATDRCSPVREFCSATDWCQVCVAQIHTAAVKTSGQIWAWGSGSDGKLGNGTTAGSNSPVREICSATNWCQVSASCFHTTAINTSGELWAWGNNVNATFGDGTVTASCSPVREFCSATDWCQVSARCIHTTAIKTSGELWAWGHGADGRLGTGTTQCSCSPVREFCSETNWCQVSVGCLHTVALISKTF